MSQAEALQEITGGLDPVDAPTPGESLTSPKESPLPFETSPELNTPEEVVQGIWSRVRENETALDGILDSMRDGTPLEDIAQVLLFEGFRQGQFNPDVMLLSIEPTIYLLAFLANYAEIPAEIYPEEDIEDEEEVDEVLSKMAQNLEQEELPESVTLGGTTLQRPSAVPASLLSTEELPVKEK